MIICILPLLLILFSACNEEAPLDPEDPSIWIPTVQVSGVGSDRIGAVEITDGVGYCDIEGNRIPALVYKAQFWDANNLNVFHVIAPTENELNVLYLYAAADTLRTIWHESYSKSLDSERASGAVIDNGQGFSPTPELRCLETVPVENQLVSGLTISGSQLNWSSGSGVIEIENHVYKLFPFQIVDCSFCGETPDDGWYEVHSIFRGQQQEMEFGILYLFIDDPDWVSLYYRIQLNELRLGSSAQYEANWNLDLDVGKRKHPRAWLPVRR